MKNWQSQWVRGACITIMVAGMSPIMCDVVSAATSSCVQCHTDKDMLEASLSKVKGKKSSMTSGAG